MADAPCAAFVGKLHVDPATGRHWIKECPLCGDMHPVAWEDGRPYAPCPKAPTEKN